MQFKKKPVVIEAVQWTGDNLSEIQAFYKPDSILVGNQIAISTLEGTMMASVGDWIIRGVKGEFYPCKPDVFDLTYEPVGDTPAPPSSGVSDTEFIRHIQGHLGPGQEVVCKICGKTAKEICGEKGER